ncbi:hypothetical protein OAJ89_02510 [Alphaproteobacteria bacterium]|nr:hypothetical protein [Alphaproteobacteria bacterium]
MNIYMWSGPRNLSTALMRSFENREDTKVWDEPFYAYYLKETKKNHPLANEIINKYETNLEKIIDLVTEENDFIYFQKHMSHHIIKKIPINWITKGFNCFLIRHPKEVLLSYIQKNDLIDSNDLGYPAQLRLFNYIKTSNKKILVIDAKDLSEKPEIILKKICKKINIPFTEKMLNWPKGRRDSDGIWEKIWYKNVKSSTSFNKILNKEYEIPKKYNHMYNECLRIYDQLKIYNIINE